MQRRIQDLTFWERGLCQRGWGLGDPLANKDSTYFVVAALCVNNPHICSNIFKGIWSIYLIYFIMTLLLDENGI